MSSPTGRRKSTTGRENNSGAKKIPACLGDHEKLAVARLEEGLPEKRGQWPQRGTWTGTWRVCSFATGGA